MCSEKNFWDDFGLYEKPIVNIFAYNKFKYRENGNFFENKNGEFAKLKKDLKDDEMLLYFKEQTQILLKQDDEICEFLDFEFESNVRLILQNLAKNKLRSVISAKLCSTI